jgi:hypothetical protein
MEYGEGTQGNEVGGFCLVGIGVELGYENVGGRRKVGENQLASFEVIYNIQIDHFSV